MSDILLQKHAFECHAETTFQYFNINMFSYLVLVWSKQVYTIYVSSLSKHTAFLASFVPLSRLWLNSLLMNIHKLVDTESTFKASFHSYCFPHRFFLSFSECCFIFLSSPTYFPKIIFLS